MEKNNSTFNEDSRKSILVTMLARTWNPNSEANNLKIQTYLKEQ
jgi:hypothetical protein